MLAVFATSIHSKHFLSECVNSMCDKIIYIQNKQLMPRLPSTKNCVLVTVFATPKLYSKYEKRVSDVAHVGEQRPSVILERGPTSCSHSIVLVGGLGPVKFFSKLN